MRTAPLALALTVALGLPASGRAATWEILADGSGDAPTIEAGIASAAVGDTVLVGPGTYVEELDFLGKDIVVRSAQGPEATVIDGTGGATGTVVLIWRQETRQAILEGFTVRNGNIGIGIRNAEPSVLGNVVEHNLTGAGIGCLGNFMDWRPLISGNRIEGNGNGTPLSGGVVVVGAMAVELRDNTIQGNSGSPAGGVHLACSISGAAVTGNIICGNQASIDMAFSQFAGGLLASWSRDGTSGYEISRNLVAGNVVPGGAATASGILLVDGTGAWVHHNTIVDNGGPAGSLTLVDEVTPLIEQNIVALNRSGVGIDCVESTSATLRNNLAWGNLAEDLSGACLALWDGNGNVAADPFFCDAGGGDYHPAQNSPALLHPAGPLGAYPGPGCGAVPVRPITWGRLKTRYH